MAQVDLKLDFGGNGPFLHLAHANGFPPGTYRPLADALASRYHVVALPARPLWPNTDPESTPTWRPMADDLIRSIDQLGLGRIVGVGHSLGGVLTMWAAIRRPELFRAAILIDPVILPRCWLWALRALRMMGLRQRQPLVQGARRRRRRWPDLETCYHHFRGKPLFERWPDSALWYYVQSATCPTAEGALELIYPPTWEAHVFATTPTDVWRDLPNLRTPTLIIRGEQSDTFLPTVQARIAHRLPHVRFAVIPQAGHLVPMERPTETATSILEFLADA